jgi:hypothetical protein
LAAQRAAAGFVVVTGHRFTGAIPANRWGLTGFIDGACVARRGSRITAKTGAQKDKSQKEQDSLVFEMPNAHSRKYSHILFRVQGFRGDR